MGTYSPKPLPEDINLDKFRTFQCIGWPNYAISAYGVLLNLITKIMTHPEDTAKNWQPDCYYLTDYRTHRKEFHPIRYLVALVWWGESELLWKDSPYSETIRDFREFHVLSINRRRVVRIDDKIYYLEPDGTLWATGLFPRKISIYYPEGNDQYPKYGVGDIHVHRLLAQMFIPIPQRYFDLGYNINDLQINHKDGNKSNFHLSNLEWCVPQENVQHAFDLGLIPGTYKMKTLVQIGNCLAMGCPDTCIAEHFNITPKAVSHIRLRDSKKTRVLRQIWLTATQLIKMRCRLITNYIELGWTDEDIAGKLKVDVDTLKNFMKRNGLNKVRG